MSRLLLASIVMLAIFDIGLVVFGLVTRQFSYALAGGGFLAVLALLYLTVSRVDADETEEDDAN
ncbi:hypothetical protein CRI94_08425 [Longibacter salinarum]|uniref:Uncharacterized protein n=1 Tax=Longibacter salinarum TaxID=1850348 RepID=A0A2A8CZH4_9BACT|nr:hypothetical protein [Longibacter salinarum]PEN14056.1 hypothetical protein CRI94_08425 [Longibacter salinarum]